MRKHRVLRNVVMPATLACIVLQNAAPPASSAATFQHLPAAARTATTRHHHVRHHHRRRHVHHRLVTAAEFAAWSRVAMCEEGGNWHVVGPVFSGGLGISNVNWGVFGGHQFSWNAGYASPDQQIVVAMRIQQDPPDQDGCASW
jgi:hypothetical protein